MDQAFQKEQFDEEKVAAQDKTQDYEKEVAVLEKVAMQGQAEAQCRLGAAYFKGHGVKQEHEKAVEWCEKAAAQEYIEAHFCSAVCTVMGME